MRLAHHLLRHPSGVYHFRLIVPRDLRAAVGLRVVKISLRTRDVQVARAYAYAYGARYAAAFAAYRAERMPKPPSVDDILQAAQSGALRPYEVTLPSGVTVRAEGPEDHARAMEALHAVLRTQPGAVAGTEPAKRRTMPKLSGDDDADTLPKGLAPLSVGEAARKYLLTLAANQMPDKTRTQKRAAVFGFAAWKGDAQPLTSVTRTDVAEWIQSLRNTGLATPTLFNKASYLKSCLAWAQASGYFPVGDNPAAGQVKFSTTEKRHRRKLGFRAFTPEQIQRIYLPESLEMMNLQARWGAVIGLYTGARVTEVGQIALSDFSTDQDGVWCLHITDGGAGQSLKNEVSDRTIPVHPDLIALGLQARVEALLAKGETQLFPRAKKGSVNGMGNWLSKSFGRQLQALGIVSASGKGMVGFHSLRKTVIQALQGAGVAAEARAQYVGHDLDDEHHAAYSRQLTCAELLHGAGAGAAKTAGMSTLGYQGVDLKAVFRVLHEVPR